MKSINLANIDVNKPVDAQKDGETAIYKPYRSLLAPEQLKKLSKLCPRKPAADVIMLWLGIFAAWGLVAWHPNWWTVLLAIPVIGTRFYGLFIIGHDGMHRRVLNSVAANDLFCDIFIFGPIGAITRINNKNHLQHHKHLSTEHDPDRHKHACFNKATVPEYILFLSGFKSLTTVLKNVYKLNYKISKEEHERERKDLNYNLRDSAILIGWQGALILGLTTAIGWWAYFVLWILPIFIHVFLADLVRSFLEHASAESDEEADEHRLISYQSNRIEKTLLAPMNMNYHAAHHLWTSIPYYNLPEANNILKKSKFSQKILWRNSYFNFAIKYFLSLPLVECQQEHNKNFRNN